MRKFQNPGFEANRVIINTYRSNSKDFSSRRAGGLASSGTEASNECDVDNMTLEGMFNELLELTQQHETENI